MTKGNIILLNGVTSSGKSTLSKALQRELDEPYYYIALDTFNEIICPFSVAGDKFTDTAIMDQAVYTMHCLIRDFSDRGLPVVVDHILADHSDWLYDCVDLLWEYPVFYVHVDCERDELFRRARARGYTSPERLNQIDQQLQMLCSYNLYDMTVNTSKNSAEAIAKVIKEQLGFSSSIMGFRQLKEKLDQERRLK